MFSKDLEKGRMAERQFASRLLKWDVSKIEFAPDTQFKDWDLLVTFNKSGKQKTVSYEVKEDRQAESTGNVGIEYMYKGKPSGIYTSSADIVVYKIGDKFYYSDRLKLIIELSKCLKSDVVGGDDDNSQMRLVRREVFNLLMTELGDKG